MSQVLRVVVLGTAGVGKSAVTIRYISGKFVERYDPTIEDSYRKVVGVRGKQYVLEVLDTAGTDQFAAMRDLYLKHGEGFILIYSIIARTSFVELEDIYRLIKRVKEEDDVPLVLVGNKCDLESQREVSTQDGQQRAVDWQATFFESSSKTEVNINKIFEQIATSVLESKRLLKKRGGGDSGDSSRGGGGDGKGKGKAKRCALF